MQVALTEVDPTLDPRTIVLERLPVMIGQDPEAAVCLEDQWVSRYHCEICATRDMLVVRDLGSMLGTFVNGLNVTTAQLMPGDRLTVGATSFQVDFDPKNGRRRPRRRRRAESPSLAAPAEATAAGPERDAETGRAEAPAPDAFGGVNGPSRGPLRRVLAALVHLPRMGFRRKPR